MATNLHDELVRLSIAFNAFGVGPTGVVKLCGFNHQRYRAWYFGEMKTSQTAVSRIEAALRKYADARFSSLAKVAVLEGGSPAVVRALTPAADRLARVFVLERDRLDNTAWPTLQAAAPGPPLSAREVVDEMRRQDPALMEELFREDAPEEPVTVPAAKRAATKKK